MACLGRLTLMKMLFCRFNHCSLGWKSVETTMSSKKPNRREKIEEIVQERGAISVGALAEALDVSTQTILAFVTRRFVGDRTRWITQASRWPNGSV